jgi:hypothetical protein
VQRHVHFIEIKIDVGGADAEWLKPPVLAFQPFEIAE